jgi:hypothetical protein
MVANEALASEDERVQCCDQVLPMSSETLHFTEEEFPKNASSEEPSVERPAYWEELSRSRGWLQDPPVRLYERK